MAVETMYLRRIKGRIRAELVSLEIDTGLSKDAATRAMCACMVLSSLSVIVVLIIVEVTTVDRCCQEESVILKWDTLQCFPISNFSTLGLLQDNLAAILLSTFSVPHRGYYNS